MAAKPAGGPPDGHTIFFDTFWPGIGITGDPQISDRRAGFDRKFAASTRPAGSADLEQIAPQSEVGWLGGFDLD
jgi:hypothetical protein